MHTTDELNERFAIPGVVSFDDDTGLTRARVTTSACTAEIYLQGAHLAAWQPLQQQPVLFLSKRSFFRPGKAIHGGIPIIFPWFGARAATPESPRTDGPSHGFARIEPWQLDFAALVGDDLHLSFSLAPTDLSRSLGFEAFRVAYQLTLGRALHLRLTVANDGDTPLHVGEAFHTYLHVGDVERARIQGLEGAEYLDKTEDFRRRRQVEPVLTLHGETDRLYLDTAAPITIEDPVLHRRMTVTKKNSNNTVVWNPWATLAASLSDMEPDGWRRMVCIETANAAANALVLRPREAHVMETTIAVEELA
ncbi:MAG TPA: D-hexose-6-phosphate mutarotase [Acidobacteriaceae bacterium]|jgi:glucose-6-phosphate 1-epimerase|nr:D-hexose-6-phosphate mutarotase [Acidobacteriaceae bacterium]